MKLVLVTQYRENSGTPENPYWKNKFGEEYIVEDYYFVNQEVLHQDANNLIETIDSFNEMSEEQVIHWSVEDDDYVPETEQMQMEYEGKIIDPAPRLNLKGTRVN